MKIRILGNSLRLRLTQTEVITFLEKGEVKEVIKFGATEKHQLIYALHKTNDSKIQAIFNDNKITVCVPKTQAEHWAQNNEISLQYQSPISSKETLKILIEKDFKCLTDRIHEDESDMFPNPDQENLKC